MRYPDAVTVAEYRAEVLQRLATLQASVDKILTDQQAAIDKARAEQKAIDDGVIAGMQVTIEDLTQQLADCQDQPPAGKTLWGANVGGYGNTLDETQADAITRIRAGFGSINAIRYWPNSFFTWPTVPGYYQHIPLVANLGSNIDGVNNGAFDDNFSTLCEDAPVDVWFTFAQEPESEGAPVTQWQQAQMRLGAIAAAAGNPKARFGVMLMGASYHPTRWVNTGPGAIKAADRLNFDLTDIGFVGANCYQWGKDDASADHAETVIGGVRDLALDLGKQVVIGELGARRRSTVSDSIRARWINETAHIVNSNPGLFDVVCYYETDRGRPEMVPWNLLPPPGQDPAAPENSPQAVDQYRVLCLT